MVSPMVGPIQNTSTQFSLKNPKTTGFPNTFSGEGGPALTFKYRGITTIL